MPQHRFICQDIPALRFARESFDIVSSVTVVQHLPLERQQLSLRLMSQWLKPNGYLIMLENVLAFDAPHVFPHRTDEWVRMVESTGLKRRCCWGSNYEVLFRVEARILRLLRGNKQTRDAMVPSPQPNGAHASRLKSAAKTLVAGLSFPAEWVCQKVPLATPTHSVMIFSK
jgi:hypothetical protein